jgi:CBS domain-containing protein/uncharacterized protein (DUF2267 family)
MNLERFRRNKMIVLNRQSMAYQAARAMEDNHIGAVLVSGPQGLEGVVTDRDLALAVLGGDLDPDDTTLDEIMSEGVITCEASAGLDDVAQLMLEHRVRRIPVMSNGRLAGLVTFDDLVVDGSIDLETLRAIVVAQLEVEAPQKPAGALHPKGPVDVEQRAAGRTRALMRSKARAEQVYQKLIMNVADASGLGFDGAERASIISMCMLCRRLVPEEARHLIAQLPSLLQAQLDQCLDGPDRLVTTEAIREQLGRTLGAGPDVAESAMQAVFRVNSDTVSEGQIDEVRGQLPGEMKYLFPEFWTNLPGRRAS